MNTNNINNENNTSSTGNNGNRGKFSDRLKKMRRDRLKLKKGIPLKEKADDKDVVEENILKRGGRNVLKVALAFPAVAYSAIKSNKSDKTSKVNIDNVEGIKGNDLEQEKVNRKIKVNKIREMDVSLLKKQREIILKEKKRRVVSQISDEISNVIDDESKKMEKEKRIEILQKEIINLIKKKLVKNINELEVLQSELYLLKEVSGEDLYLKDCQEDIKEIKKLLSKIKALKEKYDYLNDNVDFEYMLEYRDDLLVDKILELKELCSNDDIKYIVDNYKILDEYKFLYLKIDKLYEDTIKYDEYKNEKEKELKKRDIDFDKLKNDVYDVDIENDRYERFVREQEMFLRDLESKVSNIDSHEEVTYKLKGFSQLLGNSFKYLGLLLVNPLKGLIPGIATQTIVTKNLIHNLYNNLELEENRKMVYEAIDYSTSINIAINNLDSTLSLVNSTLEDVIRLKNKYQSEFSKFQYSFSSYRDVIKKINKMENAVLGSKIKIELMQQRMKEKERQNLDKMKKVKKLNSSMNN